jgi:hypothetical protein
MLVPSANKPARGDPVKGCFAVDAESKVTLGTFAHGCVPVDDRGTLTLQSGINYYINLTNNSGHLLTYYFTSA